MLRKYQKCVVVYSAIMIFTDKKLRISMPDGLVQSLKSPFFPSSTPYIGAEPGRAKGEFRILTYLHAHAKSGENHICNYFPDLACGAIF